MKRIFFTVIFTLLALSIGMSCSEPQKQNNHSEILTQKAFKDSIQNKGIQLADLRTPEEHTEEGNFSQAKNVDFLADDFYDQMEATFDRHKPLYLHCKRGKKSHKAAKKLTEMGFTEVYELQGGFDNWQEAE